MNYSKGELAKNILIALAGTGVLTISLALPNFPQVLKLFKKNDADARYRIKRVILALKKKRFIKIYEKDNMDVIEITEDGKKKILTYKIDEMKIRRPKKWDGRWRLVAFDIPERHKKARVALSYKLKQIGLYPFQKSVFLTPFDCSEEIDFIGEFFRVRKYINCLMVSGFEKKEQEEYFKIYFNL